MQTITKNLQCLIYLFNKQDDASRVVTVSKSIGRWCQQQQQLNSTLQTITKNLAMFD